MPNLKLRQKKNLSSFRRIAIGTWRTVGDPSVYGSLTLRADKVLAYIEEFRRVKKKHLTITHLMGKVISAAMEEMPDANAILRYNRIYLREDIGVFYQIAMEDPKTGELDLSGTTVHSADKKSVEEIFDEISKNVKVVRAGKDKNLESTRGLFKKIPYFFLNTFLKLISLFSYTFNLDLRWAGIPEDAFGSVMITNIGSLGLEAAYVPLVPYSKVPLLIAVGGIKEVPVVENGEIIPAKEISLYSTFDHRVLDGSHAAIMSRVIKKYFNDPFRYFDSLEEEAPQKEDQGES